MGKILQLKIILKDIEPKIWRRFLVYDNISFHKLHEIIQDIMGWENYHLYSFDVDDSRIDLPDEEGYSEVEAKNSKKIKLYDFLIDEKQKFIYLYDFGDSWEHDLIIEKILDNIPKGVSKIPYCLEGERACPPEDCGGGGGYERFVQILETEKDPYGEDVKELKEWLGDWKPEGFDINKINKMFK